MCFFVKKLNTVVWIDSFKTVDLVSFYFVRIAFKLDEVNRELYLLSRKLLETTGRSDLEAASLLISVSEVIRTPIDIYNFPRASDASSATVFLSNSP